MLKIFIILLVVSTIENKPTGCKDVNGTIWNIGLSKDKNRECMRLTCKPNGYIYGTGCGHLAVKQGCRESDYDNKRPFPQCCPFEIC